MEAAAVDHGITGRGLLAEISPEGARATLHDGAAESEHEKGDPDV